MAELISEFLFLRYFFGKMDRRKLQVLKQNFMVDMQFNIVRGYVLQATKRFSNRNLYVRNINLWLIAGNCYENLQTGHSYIA